MSSPPAAKRRPVVRRRTDAALVLVGAVVLVLCALAISPDRVSGPEADVFRAVNDTVTLPFLLVWPAMQLGNALVVPASAAVAALLRRFRLALSLLLAGGLTYVLAKVVKRVVTRGRPGELLDDVRLHGAAAQGLGFVSGHAAVIAALVTVALPYVGRRARLALLAVVVAVCLARVYVGAHLPLDVLGGAALGVAVGGAVRLLLGRPAPCS